MTATAGPRVCFVTCRQWPEVSDSDRLNEPGLFFPLAPAAAERFAEAILERVGAGRGPARR